MHDLESNIFCMRYTSHWKKKILSRYVDQKHVCVCHLNEICLDSNLKMTSTENLNETFDLFVSELSNCSIFSSTKHPNK